MDLICIKSYAGRDEAELARGFLEANGIRAIVSAEDCGGARPELLLGTGGVKLLVKAEDRRAALDILKNVYDA